MIVGRGAWEPLRLSRQTQKDVIQWDVATWRHALGFWASRSGSLDGKIGLELGGRDGGLSLFLALNGCRAVCSDVDGPTARASNLHQDYGVQDLVSYHSIDAKSIRFSDEHFDLVIIKSVLGAMGNTRSDLRNQREAVREIHRVLKPGGLFLFAENMEASPVHGWLRRHFVPWGPRWQYFNRRQLTDLLSGFIEVELRLRGFFAAWGRSERQRALLHAVDLLVVPLIPSTWRYVVFGVAKKGR